MNSSLMVQYAVTCLEALDVPLKPEDVSRSQNVPLEDCRHILRQFESAGMVRENAQGLVERTCEMETLTALQVLQALWRVNNPVAVKMLYGESSAVMQQVIIAAWPRG